LGLLLISALTSSALVLGGFIGAKELIPSFNLPHSLPVLDALLAFLCIASSRVSIRFTELWRRSAPPVGTITNVVIMGAGHAGDLILREIVKNPQLNLCVVAFLDDNPRKHGVRIHGIPVLGGRDALPALVKRAAIGRVIIAMPTAPGKEIRRVVELCRQVGVQAQTVPGLYELLNGTVDANTLRKVQIEDLLRRAPIQTDTAAVQHLLRGKRVLVTGGGGSIGSELCRQILRCQPEQLILIGHGENSIFEISNELQRLQAEWPTTSPGATAGPIEIVPVIADLRFGERLNYLLQRYQPQVIFHAAAHKHVPLMELHPSEAITNNVLGTRNLLAAAQKAQVERFVMISTDKAVNPTSIMGASKRAAELLVHQAAKASGRAYQVVRFGNVLGSRGSVVHTFRQQIAAGGPVTVTHPEMVRYFMTIPEAVQLLLQASVLGKGGEVFMLDMGEPVKIVDLARDLIALSGLAVDRDIEITFSGLRPGEKLYEEMFTLNEQYQRTQHEKVLVATNASHFVPPQLDQAIESLLSAAWRDDQLAVRLNLQALVPEYKPNSQGQPRPTPQGATASVHINQLDEVGQRLSLPLPTTAAFKPMLGA
jgi:FlaA1/EpsC-like NDP-sugar epimerase